jgi:hypothetical protein
LQPILTPLKVLIPTCSSNQAQLLVYKFYQEPGRADITDPARVLFYSGRLFTIFKRTQLPAKMLYCLMNTNSL